MELQLSTEETDKVKTLNYPMKEKNDINSPKSVHAGMKDYMKHMGVSFTIVHSKNISSGTTGQEDFKSKLEAAANEALHTSETSDKVQKCDKTSTNNPSQNNKEELHKQENNSDNKADAFDNKCETEEYDEINEPPVGYEFIPNSKFEEIFHGKNLYSTYYLIQINSCLS